MEYEEIGAELTKFKDFRPTQFDQKGLGSEGQEDWRVLPCSITRDTGPLSESNFEAAKKMLDEKEIEYEVHRFGHWGPGWFEVIVVKPTPEGLELAGQIASSLGDYPILDEMDHSERELEAVYQNWTGWQEREFLDAIEKEVHERTFKLIEDEGLELLYEHVNQLSRGYNYEGDDPYLDTRVEDFDRQAIAKLVRAIRKQVRCSGCKCVIDPKQCWCGLSAERHNPLDGHDVLPMGCQCGRATSC